MGATVHRGRGRGLLAGSVFCLAVCGVGRAQVCDRWVRSESSGPGPRAGAAVTRYFGSSAVFGGQAPDGRYYDDDWSWNGLWSPLRSSPSAPSPRAGHALTWNTSPSGRSGLMLFGGQTEAGLSSETWVFRNRFWSLHTSSGPPAMRGHAMAVQPIAPRSTILFGGQTVTGFSGQTWSWDGDVWRLEAGPGPSARWGHAMAADGLRGTVLLFGGQTGAGLSGETWAWSRAEGWVLRATTGPSPRRGHAMAWYHSLGGVVLYGGVGDTGMLSDTWVWDGVAWAPVATGGEPPAQAGHVLADEDYRGRLMMFGGENAAHAAETWELIDERLLVTMQPYAAVDRGPFCRWGATATLTVGAAGAAPVEFRWRKDGVPLADDGRVFGSATATMAIARPSDADIGDYDVVITSPCGALTAGPIRIDAGFVCRQDINCDGVVNVQDFLEYLRLFGEGDPGTDLNQDGRVNVQDFLYFLATFSASC
jgi:hypothetical protein